MTTIAKYNSPFTSSGLSLEVKTDNVSWVGFTVEHLVTGERNGCSLSFKDAADLVRKLAPLVGLKLASDPLQDGDFARVESDRGHDQFERGSIIRILNARPDEDGELYVEGANDSRRYFRPEELSGPIEVVEQPRWVEVER